ncbi:hypothetical protein J4573_46770 [Actinomadura barringtoniae]|uniref:OmdA domain containing protein n=1 Tax=Actinomadura barringtoniae TaxID=1427535 RepID=A0A939PKL8_9ACTN|nr:hypothetical protein [Actinomadura barringtoniae]MBO2454662.1 hypothetical protein [Actinomadura barringtoniae]
MTEHSGTEAVVFGDAEAWEDWLVGNHDRSSHVWLKIAKKGSRASTVTIGQALEVALCHGWIDGHRKALDENYYLQRYSPRRPRSNWSWINVQLARALIEAGRMRPAGLAAIEAAQADGRWARAESQGRQGSR